MKSVYPFIPKSSTKLTPGDFWAIPLDDGSFACGRVIELPPKGRGGARVSFLGALLDWHGPMEPTATRIAGARTLTQSVMRIKAIIESGGQILGHRPLEEDNIEPFEQIDGATILRGFVPVRAWRVSDNDSLPTFAMWGYDVISREAHKRFLKS
ncbi:Imm26 family immunity protein [Pseudomonas sp. UV AK001]|uniref:Imm26 family immunity protein n=1 Tax=Pseudomonas sp. UV AK001 TaxID=3384791 RepID=UPI0038D5101B